MSVTAEEVFYGFIYKDFEKFRRIVRIPESESCFIMIINALSHHLHMPTPSPLEDKATAIKISVDIHKTPLGIRVIEYTTSHFSAGPSEERRVIYDLELGCVNEQGKVLAKYSVEGYSRQDYFAVKDIPNIDTMVQMADSPLREELKRWIQ